MTYKLKYLGDQIVKMKEKSENHEREQEKKVKHKGEEL